MFDEVISGFRAAAGGAQQVFGVRPDLTCLGKIIGGGLPVGAYGGRADVMELVAPVGTRLSGGNAVGKSAGDDRGAVVVSSELSPKLYRHLARLGARAGRGLADAARDAGVPLQVNAFGSLVTPFFTSAAGPRLSVGRGGRYRRLRARSSAACSRAACTRRPRSSKRGSFPAAHTEKDVDEDGQGGEGSAERNAASGRTTEPVNESLQALVHRSSRSRAHRLLALTSGGVSSRTRRIVPGGR